MKRTILYSAFVVGAFTLGYAGSAQVATRAVTRVADSEGQECIMTDGSGRSGYMVSTGRSGDPFACQLNGAS